LVESGTTQVISMTSSVNEIHESLGKLVSRVNSGNESFLETISLIEDISQKTKIINDIVFQTKLLSFNASVEAARAGEHGKGFSVVAEEIGALAAVSGKAATEINSLVSDSIKKVQKIVDTANRQSSSLIKEVEQKVRSGLSDAEGCRSSLQEINIGINELSKTIITVSESTEEQASSIKEISSAMNLIEKITQDNSRSAFQAKSEADGLIALSKGLTIAVRDLYSLIQGGLKLQPQPSEQHDDPPQEQPLEAMKVA
ncbi:MAG: hypothetical protein KDD35_00220, partial [Bdellovibrionales bacterium]|nr:hypothetical protein [Bdellovibrionales bacterium]